MPVSRTPKSCFKKRALRGSLVLSSQMAIQAGSPELLELQRDLITFSSSLPTLLFYQAAHVHSPRSSRSPKKWADH